MSADVTLPAAAAAGLLSFLSPCVLPLVPPYLTYLAGVSMEDLEFESRSRARRDVLLSAVLFVLGFTTVFVALGATASAFGARLDMAFKSRSEIRIDLTVDITRQEFPGWVAAGPRRTSRQVCSSGLWRRRLDAPSDQAGP